MDEIRLFVLEANLDGPDIPFTQAVMSHLTAARASLHVYEPTDLVSFVSSMSQCDVAVSMKLHSSAIWAAAGIPIFPISYAPKTAAFFGVPYRGLEIFSTTMDPVSDLEVPRAEGILEDWLLRTQREGFSHSKRSSFTSVQMLKFQFLSFVTNVRRRLFM